MKLQGKEENHSVMRVYYGGMKRAVIILLCVWTAFQFYAVTTGVVSAVTLRAVHALFLLVFTFLLFPACSKEGKERRVPPWYDVVFIGASVFCFGYLIFNYTRVAQSGGRITNAEILIAVVAVFCVFEAARRTSGKLAFFAFIFLSYNWWGAYIPFVVGHNGFSLHRIALSQFWGTEGLLGSGVAVSATYIFLFVVLGSFLKYSGFAKLVNDLALSLVGGTAGGPAKVAVIASGLMGMINGSAVANVATTGTITIPMMKRAGYSREFAGAVEAVASTGGQFTPPIMGAVAFVMAEFLNVSYGYVALASITPAFLYYAGLLFAVHLEARRLGLSGISRENMPKVRQVLRREGHLICPLVSLVGLMFLGYTPLWAATVSLFVTVVASWFRWETRMTLGKILSAVTEGARNAVAVGVCCLVIGTIIGTVTLTSLGLHLGYLILSVAEGYPLYVTGFFVMLMSVILGMGVPGVAAYVIVQAVAVPVLVKAGALPMVAHLFCLMYACLSNITPPVAMSAYVASGIAGSDQTKTGLLAVRLGIIGFIIPFFFLCQPVLLLGVTSHSWLVTAESLLTALIGTLVLVATVEGQGIRRCYFMERGCLCLAGLFLLYPGVITDVIGGGIVLGVLLYQYKKP